MSGTPMRQLSIALAAGLAGFGLLGCGVSTTDSAVGVGPGYFEQCDERYIPVEIFIKNTTSTALTLDYQHAYQVPYETTSDQIAAGDTTEVLACVQGNTDSGGASQMDTDGLDLQYVDPQGNAWNLYLSAVPSNANNADDRDGTISIQLGYNTSAKNGPVVAQANVAAGYVPGSSGTITQLNVSLAPTAAPTIP